MNDPREWNFKDWFGVMILAIPAAVAAILAIALPITFFVLLAKAYS